LFVAGKSIAQRDRGESLVAVLGILVRKLRAGKVVRIRLSAAVSDPAGTSRTVAKKAKLKGRP